MDGDFLFPMAKIARGPGQGKNLDQQCCDPHGNGKRTARKGERRCGECSRFCSSHQHDGHRFESVCTVVLGFYAAGAPRAFGWYARADDYAGECRCFSKRHKWGCHAEAATRARHRR